MYTKAVTGQLEKLNTQECISAYAKTFQTDRRHIILVTDSNDPANLPMPGYSTANEIDRGNSTTVWLSGSPFDWMCDGARLEGGSCDSRYKEIVASDWQYYGSTVQYCLSERITPTCRLRFNPGLALVVIVFNLLKAVTLFITWYKVGQQPLLTLGEAVASFLSRSDKFTEHAGWLDRRKLRWEEDPDFQPSTELQVHGERQRWSSALTRFRWFIAYLTLTALLGIVAGLLAFSVRQADISPRALLLSELGGLNTKTFITRWDVVGVIRNVLVANTPQVILSFVYVQYNGSFTSMMLGAEWNRFASVRKGLRVSASPTGAQRSTYFLQLPYRAAFPLMALSATLHWLCSQSLFLVSITIGRFDDSIDERITCGYSPPAILTTIGAGILMMFVTFLVGRRRYPNIMPVAGSCSLAISAACHPAPGTEGDEDPTLPVQWGRSEDMSSGDAQEVHYSFSSRHVFPFVSES